MSYHYSLLQFVPDPARGEFVNLGILVGDDEAQDWELRLIQNFRRANAIDDKGALGIALGFAATLENHIAVAVEQLPGMANVTPISLEWVAQLSDEMQNVVQLSPPTPVVAESAETALDMLFGELVVDPASQQFRFPTKKRAQASTRQAYRDHAIPRTAVTEKAPISAGPYDGIFDFAVANGRVVQLVQCWSFQLPNQIELAEQVKAWAWVVHELRQQDGLLRLDERELVVPRDEIEIATVYIPPEEGQNAPAFDEALAAFEEIQVTQLLPDQADVLGEHAAERLQIPA